MCQLMALFPEQPEYNLGSLSLIVDYYRGLNRSASHRRIYLSTWFVGNVVLEGYGTHRTQILLGSCISKEVLKNYNFSSLLVHSLLSVYDG